MQESALTECEGMMTDWEACWDAGMPRVTAHERQCTRGYFMCQVTGLCVYVLCVCTS